MHHKIIRSKLFPQLTLNDAMRIHRLRDPQNIITAYVNKQEKKALLAKEDQLGRISAKWKKSVENTNVQ